MDWEPRVGMRVVCIADKWANVEPFEVLPKKGQCLTIRTIYVRPDNGVVYLRFREILNPTIVYSDGEGEASFRAHKFRPLDERRLDIFRAVLIKAPTPEKEPA